METNSTHDLLLDAISLEPGKLKRDRLQALSSAQWEALPHVAQQQHVVPLLYARLKEKGMETAVPPPIWHHLHHTYRANALRNRCIYDELHTFTTALHQANIPVILLKGAFLANTVYNSIGERIIGDLDLMVHKAAMPQVMPLSEQCGYQKTKPVLLDISLENRHHIPPLIKRSVQLMVEWHWHIARPGPACALPAADLWQRAVPVVESDPTILTLAPEDLMLHVAHHSSYHHEFTFGIRSLCDLAVISRYYVDALDWDQVVARAQAWQWQRGVYLALQVAHDRFGAAIPAEVRRALCPENGEDAMVKTAVSQLFVDPTAFRHVPYTWRDLQSKKGVRRKLNVVRRALFPSAERMALRYGIPPGTMSPRQQIGFRWQNLARHAVKTVRQLLHSDLAVIPAVRDKNSLSTWMRQNQDE